MEKIAKINFFSLWLVLIVSILLQIYAKNNQSELKATLDIKDVLFNIKGYQCIKIIELPKKSFKMLNLDDYIFADYKNNKNNNIVNLYIGYYYSSKKAYAAHTPTICYPSQGWEISKIKSDIIQKDTYKIKYSEITTHLGDKKELILYWYQAGALSDTSSIINKFNIGYNKLFHKNSSHGFIRVAVPIISNNYKAAKDQALTFINDFYPQLTNFISSNQPYL